jgi:signal transduction histidine kinase
LPDRHAGWRGALAAAVRFINLGGRAPARNRAQSRVEIAMKLPSSHSLRRKLLGMMLLTTLVALVVALAAMIGYDLNFYHRILVSDMTTQAELLGRTSARALALDDARVGKENLSLFRFRPQVNSAALYDARGALFATYEREDDRRAFPELPERDSARVADRDLVLFKRIVKDGKILGTVYLRADYEIFDRVFDYLGIAAVVLAAAMLVALLISSWTQNIVTRPILAIAQIAREVVGQRDYSRRAVKMSSDEVGMLADSFNDMLTEIDRRTRELEASNARLAQEVEVRSRAEREILRLNAELENRVRERTAQLETAMRELESFSYSVSHDLRAPLRAIDGFGQALVEDFPENLPADARRYLSRIRTSTQHMARLIEDLLNLARVSRGKLDRRTVDLSQVARQVVSELQQGEPGRAVEVSVWDGMLSEADPHLLRVALENLIGNAWKFTSKGAKPRIEIGALKDRGPTTFFVRDNGAGFDMAYAGKLFGAFQRLHSASEYPGTGIGLATVQRIVHRHGGRIWAQAEAGKGAMFFFTLAIAGEETTDAGPVGEKVHG